MFAACPNRLDARFYADSDGLNRLLSPEFHCLVGSGSRHHRLAHGPVLVDRAPHPPEC